MKILFSCLSESWGGMEMIFLETAHLLKERNLEIEILAVENSRIAEEAENMGFKLNLLKRSGYISPSSILSVRGFIKRGKFSHLHTYYSKDLWVLVPALKLANSNASLFLTKQMGSFIVKKDIFHKVLYKRVTNAISISNVITQNLIDTCPLEPEKIALIPNWADLDRFDPFKCNGRKVREEYQIGNDELVIGMAARFTEGKGHEEFIKAASKLENKNLRFMMVGEASRGEQEYEEYVKEMVKKYNLEDKTVFTGFRKDMPDVLAAMDIFAFPSHSEAFGIALLEAMAVGKPSVCTSSDGVLDIAVDNETGLLFQKKDADDLAEKLGTLIESKEKRERFGIAARKRAETFFRKEDQIDKIVELYRDLEN